MLQCFGVAVVFNFIGSHVDWPAQAAGWDGYQCPLVRFIPHVSHFAGKPSKHMASCAVAGSRGVQQATKCLCNWGPGLNVVKMLV